MTTPYIQLAAILRFTATYDRWTRAEFMAGTGISRASTERIVAGLHANKAIHVDGWLDDSMGRPSIAVFTLGAGKDASRRTAKTGSQRQRAYRERRQLMAARGLQDALAAMARGSVAATASEPA